VLVSSHVLSEVQQTVDDVIIIAKGRLVHASSLADLALLTTRQVLVKSPDAERLAALVAAEWPGRAQTVDASGSVLVRDVDASVVGAAAFRAGIELHELASRDVGLEDIFLQLTGDGAPPPADPGGGYPPPGPVAPDSPTAATSDTSGGAA